MKKSFALIMPALFIGLVSLFSYSASAHQSGGGIYLEFGGPPVYRNYNYDYGYRYPGPGWNIYYDYRYSPGFRYRPYYPSRNFYGPLPRFYNHGPDQWRPNRHNWHRHDWHRR